MQKAYKQLETDGYIYSIKGKGNFVTYKEELMEYKKKELKKKLAIPLLIIVGTFVANYFFDVNLMYAILVDAMLGFMLLRDEKYS